MSTTAVTADGRARVLADGNEIPLLGLGVWQVRNGRKAVDAVRWALELGYRHIDTAQAYGNEESVGEGLRRSGVSRDDVYLTTKFYPAKADPSQLNWPMTVAILALLVIYVTMVYGPIAAFLVELFPTKIRYTSMSLPYHIGNGWFGGMLPLTATAMVAATGDIYYGLWYPIVVAIMTLVIGSLFLSETRERDIRTYDHSMLP